MKDRPPSRRWFTHIHLWLGRSIIPSGLVNCGLGLVLVPVDWKYVIIWWAICGLLLFIYAIAFVLTFRFRAKKVGEPFGNSSGNSYRPEHSNRTETCEIMNPDQNVLEKI